MRSLFCLGLVAHVGQKSNLTSTLDSGVELVLVLCTGAGNAAGKDLCALGDELSQLRNVLVIDAVNLVRTEDANLLFSVVRTEGTRIIVVSFHRKKPKPFWLTKYDSVCPIESLRGQTGKESK